jgi:hypothetical protein
MYPRGRDRDGKRIFFFDSIRHVRGVKNIDDIKKMFLYWSERIFREENYDKITIVFDLTNTGMKHVDLDLTNYQISVLKSYYPNTVNWILVHNMPWIMNGS